MRSRIFGTFWVTTICCIISAAALLELPAECDAMSIAPSRIVLNAECVGNSQDIQAIFPLVWASNYEFVEGRFYFEDDEDPVCITYSFHYCVLDDVLLVSFDRGEIQAYAKEYKLEGDVLVKVEVDFDDGTETSMFYGTDFVEILAPGKKK